MKNTFRFILAAGVLAFATSCEDRGTTTETVSSNDDEYVNPKHIRGYGDRELGGVDSLTQLGGRMYAFDINKLNPQARAMPSNQLATEIVKIYYDPNRQLSELMQGYMASDTAMSGGQTTEMPQTTTDTSTTTDRPVNTVTDNVNEVIGALRKDENKMKQDKTTQEKKPVQKSNTKKQ